MSPVEGNMEMLSKAVLSEAQTEADQVLAEARSKAEAIRRRAEEQAAAERKTILDRANQEAERIRRQAIATAQINARNQQLAHREQLLNKALEAVSQQLPGVQQWSDYDQIALQLAVEALTRLETKKAVVRADPVTQKQLTPVLDDLSKRLGIAVQLGEPLEQGTGVIAETEDGRRRYDNTLGTRLSRMQDSLRSPAYHLLMGESL